MAGVFTDNQPDFSYLAPYETKMFSQFWWPLQRLGPVQNASERAALRLVVHGDRRLDVGVAVPTPLPGAHIVLTEADRVVLDERRDLRPGEPFVSANQRLGGDRAAALELKLLDAAGGLVLAYRAVELDPARRARAVAVEPPSPADARSTDELFLIGEHLEQYRHPTRDPEPYWREAIRRDSGDCRCHLALGRRLLRRGEFDAAAECFGAALGRLTERHPNPVTGEAHYHLGLVRRWQDRVDEAYPLFYKATWDYAWRSAAYYELATLDCRRGDFAKALGHLEASLDTNRQNNKAQVLQTAALRRLGRKPEAARTLDALLHTDPLDHWARHEEALLSGECSTFLELSRNDGQTALDVAFDYADAGFYAEAIALLERHHTRPVARVAVPNPPGSTPSTRYALAWLKARAGEAPASAASALADARRQPADYFFPSRGHEMQMLLWAAAQKGRDPLAHYALGNHGRARIGQPAQIDYFATSLPNLLVFEEDLQARRDAEHHLLVALGAWGLASGKRRPSIWRPRCVSPGRIITPPNSGAGSPASAFSSSWRLACDEPRRSNLSLRIFWRTNWGRSRCWCAGDLRGCAASCGKERREWRRWTCPWRQVAARSP